GGLKDVATFVADASGLTGALTPTSGVLVGTANFDASLFNGPGVVVVTTKDGTATVTVSTLYEGGSGIGVTTITQGSNSPNTDEVQEVVVRGGGTFSLEYWFNDADHNGSVDGGESETTAEISSTALPAVVKSALEALAHIDSVDVTSRLVAAGTVYDISFGGTLAHTNVTQLIPHGGSLTARNEVQQVDVEGAASGTYNLKFTFDANGNGTLDAGEESASTPFTVGWTDAQGQAALEGMSSIGAGNVAVAVSGGKYTIGFIGALAAKNLPSLQLTSTTLTAQDEQQKVQVVNATGGTFTLTIAYNDGVTRRT